jgi:aminoglycoside 3-N-acetyltransferase
VDAVGALGVRPGELLLAHSSLSSFGHVVGGADAVALALVDAVGHTGTAFVPQRGLVKSGRTEAACPSA